MRQGFTCLRHIVITETIKELSPKAIIPLLQMLTYSEDFVIRSGVVGKQIGLSQSKYMTPRMKELVDKGYIDKNGLGENTQWVLTLKALRYKVVGYEDNYFRLYNDTIERLMSFLNEGEALVYLFMLTNALTYKVQNSDIEKRLGLNNKTISRHLNKLSTLGLIEREEVNNNIVYWKLNKTEREKYIVVETDGLIYNLYDN